MILGSGLALANPGIFSPAQVVGLMLFPLVARAFGLVASIIGVLLVKAREDEDPMHALNRGYMWTAVLAAAGFVGGTYWLLNPRAFPAAWWHFALCGVIGIATSIAFVYITQYYTEYRYRPVKTIAAASVTGPATNIIAGFAVALECTALPTFTISAAIIASYKLGASSGLAHAGLFGTAVATMGMLGTAAYILAMDTFGPITDNAGGIIEMSHQPEDIRKRTDRLDAVGNTTKALTKGYAIGSAALAAFLLFSAYLDEVAALGSPLAAVDISKPEVFVGGLLGAMLVFWFSAVAIGAVTKAAVSVIKEVRRQFQADPGILKGTSRPDYGTAVDIVTIGALKAMVAPGLLAVGMPIAVGLVFKLFFHVGAETVAAFLMVGTIGGILTATLLNNGGGAWDNAKKFIETGEDGGEGGPTHKAAVGGDTGGDPFQDTAGGGLPPRPQLFGPVAAGVGPPFFVANLCPPAPCPCRPAGGKRVCVFLRDLGRAGGLGDWMGSDPRIRRRQRRRGDLLGGLFHVAAPELRRSPSRMAHDGIPDGTPLARPRCPRSPADRPPRRRDPHPGECARVLDRRGHHVAAPDGCSRERHGEQRHGDHQAPGTRTVHHRRSHPSQPGELSPVRSERLSRRPSGGGDRLFRLHRVRRDLDRRGRNEKPATQPAHRDTGRARHLHSDLHDRRRCSDGNGA